MKSVYAGLNFGRGSEKKEEKWTWDLERAGEEGMELIRRWLGRCGVKRMWEDLEREGRWGWENLLTRAGGRLNWGKRRMSV
jgi:hypothetical protein